MPPPDSPALIVARYLRSNNYDQSYEAFICEAGLPRDSGNASTGVLTLETLLEEKRTFDVSRTFEKLGVEDGTSAWSQPAPSIAQRVTRLPASNILDVQLARTPQDGGSTVLLASTADRRFAVLDATTGDLQSSHESVHGSPILASFVLKSGHLLTSSMSGHLILSSLEGEVLETRLDHMKYVIKIAVFEAQDETIIATAGWDAKICIYKVSSSTTHPTLGEPAISISLATKPEEICFVRHPDTARPTLLVSRTDSCFIFFYAVEAERARLIGKQSLAPHSNAWVAFTPSAFQPSPTDPSLLAVATSAVPYMTLLIVRILFPPWAGAAAGRTSLLDDDDDDDDDDAAPATETQASQARAALAVADREAAAIQIQCGTLAPQTAYSTPAVAWRPDGSGVWVNGDDGVLRGIEASTGKVVATLRGHAPDSKIRCVCAGVVGAREVVVSGGFDHKLIIWRPDGQA